MKKSTKIVLIVLAIVIPLVLLIGGGLLVLGIVIIGGANSAISNLEDDIITNIHTRYDLAGTWYDSTKNVYVSIGSYNNTIEFYTSDKSTLYMKGTYTIEQDYDNEVGDEYILTITTYDRVIDGKKYTDKYTTQFSIVTEDYKEAVMMNVVTYTLYYLTKINSTTPSSSSSYSSYSSNTILNSTNTLTNSTATNTLSTNTISNSVSRNTTSTNSNTLNTNSYYTNTYSNNTIH